MTRGRRSQPIAPSGLAREPSPAEDAVSARQAGALRAQEVSVVADQVFRQWRTPAESAATAGDVLPRNAAAGAAEPSTAISGAAEPSAAAGLSTAISGAAEPSVAGQGLTERCQALPSRAPPSQALPSSWPRALAGAQGGHPAQTRARRRKHRSPPRNRSRAIAPAFVHLLHLLHLLHLRLFACQGTPPLWRRGPALLCRGAPK